MGSPNGRESCGRCSFSTIVDAIEATDESESDDGEPVQTGAPGGTTETDDTAVSADAETGEPASAETRERYDPFAGGHIELGERELRMANAPAILAGRLKRRLDDAADRFIYGDRLD